MKYLVESPQNENREEPVLTDGLEEGFKLLDPACGSGHILVEGFYHLYDMYKEEYYMPNEAVEMILQHNLYGLDIDLRAAQLSQFAVLLAAASKHPDILKSEVSPHIYAMPEPERFTLQEIREFLGSDGLQHEKVLTNALELMQQAKNLGSVMQFNVTDAERRFFMQRIDTLQSEARTSLIAQSLYNKFLPFMQVIHLMTDRYEAIAANPPYMGGKSMNSELSSYVSEYYPKSKADLMTVFMDVIPSLTKAKGRFSMINLPSWLFLSSFENLRKDYTINYHIESLLHMGRGIFGIDFGSVAFAIRKANGRDLAGTYFRLHERNFQHIYYEDIEKLFLYSKNKPEYRYDFGQYRDVDGVTEIPQNGTQTGLKLFYPNIPQSNFSKIPGSPIAYWISKSMLFTFKQKKFSDLYSPATGMQTGDNKLFIRYWSEIEFKKFNLKWYPLINGGEKRKWYGNTCDLILWENNGAEIREHPSSVIRNAQYYFQEGGSWNRIASNGFSVRFFPKGFIFDQAGDSFFKTSDSVYLETAIAFLNSKVGYKYVEIICPTLNVTAGNIGIFPVFEQFTNDRLILRIVHSTISISKCDWDYHETSWDFSKLKLLSKNSGLQRAYNTLELEITKMFYQLHMYEEELNRLFISIYELSEDLSPTVLLKEITILQEELDLSALDEVETELRKRREWRLEEGNWNLYVDNELQSIPAEGELPNATVQTPLPIKKNVVMQQLISYAVGCMMGRYSLDAPGLILANQGDTLDDYYRIVKEKQESDEKAHEISDSIMVKFVPDDDAIIPIMGSNCGFPDDAVHRISHFIEVVWGSETLTQNINFLQSCLDMDIEKYLTTQGNFWKDHCSRYKKKPIYWLFSSKKGAFQVLVYMHRMNRFTVQKIRDNYLLRHLQWLNNQIAQLQANASSLSRVEAKRLDYLRSAFAECEEYDLHLKNIADQQIEFDLDDGVLVNYEKFTPVVAPIK